MSELPPGTEGDAGLVRVGLPLLRDEPRGCPHGRSLRARPLVVDPNRVRRKPIVDFALKPVMDALDLIEHRKKEVGAALAEPWTFRSCHPSHRAWAETAVTNYLAARTTEEESRRAAGRPATFPVREEWVAISRLTVPDARGARRYERTAWGRRYASADGGTRELWLPSVNSVKEDRPPAEIAAAAAVALTGVSAKARFGRPYQETGGHADVPARVRVIAVGCGDGEVRVLADWDAHEVSRRYESLAQPALRRLIGRTELNPGSDCVNCECLTGCPQPTRAPGLLGVPAPSRPRRRRSVSAADLRVHDDCPARFHLTRVLHLKADQPENPAIRRGRAVDAVLNERHGGQRTERGCRDLPLPTALPGLAEGETGPALRMLAQHRGVCPLDGLPDREQVRAQPRLTAYDPVADAVVIADPDLLYTDTGGWVWRETKTSATPLWEGRPLLESYPQLALAVVLMAAGIPGGDPRRSRIELEVLYEHGAACEVIDPFDEPTLTQARAVVARLADPWTADETYAPSPGGHCTGCEALTWCEAGRAQTNGR
ncbi:PD-(D/E)XK nuclease family protein [Actinomadura bangladeshensis]|uniref:PD-(D/E)XK nuclease family protein n=1 Tax=Actinomadura bangladeshensis TaxID=453573 RepID=UPI001404B65C|nr:PD-(D/E)XK nuclease family protein [Actinomadura bangladeshensis]